MKEFCVFLVQSMNRDGVMLSNYVEMRVHDRVFEAGHFVLHVPHMHKLRINI